MATSTCSEIADDMIPDGGVIVFDWDNTLKIYDKKSRTIFPRVSRENLQRWKQEKRCEMYVISAIRPSRINLETLLLEVEKLGFLDIFTQENDVMECVPGEYARRGNIVICGYDKAETFLMLRKLQSSKHSVKKDNTVGTKVTSYDAIDGIVPYATSEKVIFFDDEEPNIENFSTLVKGSVCYLVK